MLVTVSALVAASALGGIDGGRERDVTHVLGRDPSVATVRPGEADGATLRAPERWRLSVAVSRQRSVDEPGARVTAAH